METYAKNDTSSENSESKVRFVVHRPSDKKSFIGAEQIDFGEKRNKYNCVLIDMTDNDLRDLRDYLNVVVE